MVAARDPRTAWVPRPCPFTRLLAPEFAGALWTRLAPRDSFFKKRWGWLRPATHALRGFPGRALIQDFSRRDLLDAHWTRLAPRTLSLKKTAGMVSQACAWGYRLSPAEAGALMRRLPVPIAVTRQAE